MPKLSFYRIIDVNLNRASEGLRVLEEISRFILENQEITKLLRKIRSNLIESIESKRKKYFYIKFRNIEKDFGKKFILKERKDLFDLVKANAKRTEEALRVLEEFTTTKKDYLKMRFQVYSIEKKILSELANKGFINNEKIDLSVYAVNDRLNILIKAVKNGAKIIQLRDKASSGKTILNKAKRIKKYIDRLPKGKKPIFIVNDRIDIALLSGADGVHLGQDDVGIKEARGLMGLGKIIGKSTHNINEGLKAQKDGASYISVGPVYKTPTKPGRPSVGLEYVKLASKKITIPWVAIGGVDKETAGKIIKSGARNIAVVRAYKDIKNIQNMLNKYYRRKK